MEFFICCLMLYSLRRKTFGAHADSQRSRGLHLASWGSHGVAGGLLVSLLPGTHALCLVKSEELSWVSPSPRVTASTTADEGSSRYCSLCARIDSGPGAGWSGPALTRCLTVTASPGRGGHHEASAQVPARGRAQQWCLSRGREGTGRVQWVREMGQDEEAKNSFQRGGRKQEQIDWGPKSSVSSVVPAEFTYETNSQAKLAKIRRPQQ